MSEHEQPVSKETETPAVALSQEQLYDDLRRIGQLEDQKRELQQEIDQRTTRLRDAIPGLDKESLLYKLLAGALTPVPRPATPKKPATAKRPRKKTAKTK